MARRFGGVIVALGLMMGGGMADAWAVADVSVRPVLPDRQVLPGPVRSTSRAEPAAKSTGSSGVTPAELSIPTSNQVEPVGFSILEFVVDGSTLLSREKIDEVLNKYKGPGKTIKDIDRARVELEKAYQQ